MISGIIPFESNYLILAYLVNEEDQDIEKEITDENRDSMKRKLGSKPELRIISKDGEELSSDVISLRNYDKFQSRDYSLCLSPKSNSTYSSNSTNSTNSTSSSKILSKEENFYVISPEDIVVAKPRDESDHITWLIEQKQYESALLALEKKPDLIGMENFDITEIGIKFLDHLVEDG